MIYLTENFERLVTVKRPAGGIGESQAAAWIASIVTPWLIDGAGNIHIKVGVSKSMFTAHLDTVHSSDGPNSVRKEGDIWHADGAALGADDAAGVVIMLEMIAAGVPGLYVFTRGEECGGIGSTWLAENLPELAKQYDRCVSFDRGGYSDVITHQGGAAGTSLEFAEALSNALNNEGLLYMPCNGGSYTDSKEFFGLIPECTNISVGYKCQHGPGEQQDMKHLQNLAKACRRIDWESLPTVRKPSKPQPKAFHSLGISTALFADRAWTVGGSEVRQDEVALDEAVMRGTPDDILLWFDTLSLEEVVYHVIANYRIDLSHTSLTDYPYLAPAAKAWVNRDENALCDIAYEDGDDIIAEALAWAVCVTPVNQVLPEGANYA